MANLVRSEQEPLSKYLYMLLHFAKSVFFFFLRCTNYFLRVDYRQNRRMNSVLDLVRQKISDLKNHRDTDKPSKPNVVLRKGHNYLSIFEEGSYQWYVAKLQVESARSQDERSMENYEKQLKEFSERKGVEEKKAAVEALQKQFISLEELLRKKNAKVFTELHPANLDNFPDVNPYIPYASIPPQPFEVEFEFRAHAMTDENRQAYIKL
jgi:hypothetical protein